MSILDRLRVIALHDAETVAEKNAQYGESWCRRGGHQAFAVIWRKADRVDSIMSKMANGYDIFAAWRENPGNIIDDFRDLRTYLMLLEEYMTRDPLTFNHELHSTSGLAGYWIGEGAHEAPAGLCNCCGAGCQHCRPLGYLGPAETIAEATERGRVEARRVFTVTPDEERAEMARRMHLLVEPVPGATMIDDQREFFGLPPIASSGLPRMPGESTVKTKPQAPDERYALTRPCHTLDELRGFAHRGPCPLNCSCFCPDCVHGFCCGGENAARTFMEVPRAGHLRTPGEARAADERFDVPWDEHLDDGRDASLDDDYDPFMIALVDEHSRWLSEVARPVGHGLNDPEEEQSLAEQAVAKRDALG